MFILVLLLTFLKSCTSCSAHFQRTGLHCFCWETSVHIYRSDLPVTRLPPSTPLLCHKLASVTINKPDLFTLKNVFPLILTITHPLHYLLSLSLLRSSPSSTYCCHCKTPATVSLQCLSPSTLSSRVNTYLPSL